MVVMDPPSGRSGPPGIWYVSANHPGETLWQQTHV